jgi:hypothetical protein
MRNGLCSAMLNKLIKKEYPVKFLSTFVIFLGISAFAAMAVGEENNSATKPGSFVSNKGTEENFAPSLLDLQRLRPVF